MTAIDAYVSALRAPNSSRVASNMLGTAMKHLSSGKCADRPKAATDFYTESTKLAAAQILSQASTAMLAQANQSQQGVLNLLR
jgi:flagellin-like hook-associated protein FlgL